MYCCGRKGDVTDHSRVGGGFITSLMQRLSMVALMSKAEYGRKRSEYRALAEGSRMRRLVHIQLISSTIAATPDWHESPDAKAF
ncbi:MAG: hypothetical protein ACLTDC_10710 [Lachnospiraceae bacterium]